MTPIKKIILALVALAVLGVGAFVVWFYAIRDEAPAALTATDRDDALARAGTTVLTTPAADTSGGDTGATTPPPTETPADSADPSGDWTISDASTLGYRVKEILGGLDAEAAGRTNQVTGTLTIAGNQATAAEFTVDVASIKSDSSRRDGQFTGPIMNTSEFPTAVFTLTAPIDFGSVPAEGVDITASATGDLTLRGVTNSVTFEVQAKLEGGRIGVFGNIPITFSDYGIANPSNGFAEVGDDGLLEFVLVFERA
jgi:polyisoprenoid-binding protein YceI